MSSLYPESWQIPPMKYCSKASDTAARQAFESGDWIMQEKIDGALYQLEKTDSGFIYLFSRTKSRKTGELVEKSANFPHIVEWASWALPNGTILIGEIYVKGGHSNDVTKLSGCLPENAVKRQFNSDTFGGPVHYYVFDIIRFNGHDIQNKSTIDRIKRYLYNTSLDYAFADQYVERAKIYYSDFENHLQEIFNKGGEGAVFKNKNCPYRAGKRSTVSQMFKWKEHLDSIDLICIGLEDPEYYYNGKEKDIWPYKNEKGELITKPAFYKWKNAFALGAYSRNGKIIKIGTVASGLTDNLKEDMAKNPDKYLNKVIQVSCMSINKEDKTLRHPVFQKMREDKNPEDCFIEEIFS